jgi:hypothetical protein
MRGIADEIFMAGGWVGPIASRRHPVEIKIGEDLVGKAPGGRRGRGFPPAIVVRRAFSVLTVIGLGTYDGTAPRCIEPLGTQTGEVRRSHP